MAESFPDGHLTIGQQIAALATALATGVLTGRWRLNRVMDTEDHEKLAKALIAEHTASDTEHRNAIVEAINALNATMQSEHQATRDEIRRSNDTTRDRVTGMLGTMNSAISHVESKVEVVLDRLPRHQP